MTGENYGNETLLSMKPKKKLSIVAKMKLVGIGLLIGLVLGVGGILFFQNFNPADSPSSKATTVFERIVKGNEMVSVSQNYCIVDKAVDRNRFLDLVDIPFTENSFWYRYAGTLKAGVNMKEARIDPLNGTTITITLKRPYIISNTPDMDKSGVLEENNNPVLNPIHVQDVDEFQRQCVERSQEDAVSGGLLEEAKTSTEENLRNMFNAALGDEYTVNIKWEE